MSDTDGKYSILCIRTSLNEISLTACTPLGVVAPRTETCRVDQDVSLNVNIRDFLLSAPIASGSFSAVEIIADVPYALKPLEYFSAGDAGRIFRHCFADTVGKRAFYEISPLLGAAFVYGFDDASFRVIRETFPDARIHPGIACPAADFATASRISSGERIYAWVHEDRTDMFAFRDGHLLLGNRYETYTGDDVAYFIMLAVKTLGFSQRNCVCTFIAPAPIDKALGERLEMFLDRVEPADADSLFRGTFLASSSSMPLDLRSFLTHFS